MFLIRCRFKVPVADQTSARGAAQRERDAWVNAIDRLCSDWKRRSRGDHAFQESAIPRNASIAEDAEVTNTDLESGGGFSGGNTRPPVADANADPASTAGDGLAAGCSKPVPVPRSGKAGAAAAQAAGPTSPSVVPRTPPLPQPSHIPLTSSSTVPESVTNESGTSAVKGPSPPSIPSPPPLPFKLKTSSKEARTKAFHWDLVGPEKVTLPLFTLSEIGGQLAYHFGADTSTVGLIRVNYSYLNAVFYYFGNNRKVSFTGIFLCCVRQSSLPPCAVLFVISTLIYSTKRKSSQRCIHLFLGRSVNHFGHKEAPGGSRSTRHACTSNLPSKTWGGLMRLSTVTPSTSCSTRRLRRTSVSIGSTSVAVELLMNIVCRKGSICFRKEMRLSQLNDEVYISMLL